jgi:hypothetical protein
MHVNLIREALHKQQFQEFTLRLTDGRALFVRHPTANGQSTNPQQGNGV